MRSRHLIAAALVASGVVLAVPEPAWADQGSGAWTDDGGIGAEAEANGSLPSVGPARDTSKPHCTYELLDQDGQTISDRMAVKGWGPPRGEEPGAWYRRRCYDSTFDELFGDVVWLRDRVDPTALAERALSYTPLRAPGIGLNPASEQVVNVATWLWVDPGVWSAQSATASVPGLSVTATATPQRVLWELGSGDRVVCTGPGTPYDRDKPESAQRTDCSYTYRRSSAGQPDDRFIITATVEWHVTWAASSGEAGDLGTVQRSASTPVRVAEAQALNQ